MINAIVERIKEEPVRFWAAVMGIVLAVFAILIGFEILVWTPEQVGLVVAGFTAVGVLFQFFFVRNKVTPVVAPKLDDGTPLVPATGGEG